MDNFLNLNLQAELKTYVKSWKSEELLFSYDCKLTSTTKKTVFHLNQLETKLWIEMVLEEDIECLRLRRFSIKEDEALEGISEALYDAALIEMVLQALDIIYFCAQYEEKPETVFFLTKEESAQLSFYNYLFSEISNISTAEGKRKLLMLPTSKYHYEDFLDEKEDIKNQVHQRIWMQQKSDPFLKQYLHLSCRQKIDLLNAVLQKKENPASLVVGNVIPLPMQASLIH